MRTPGFLTEPLFYLRILTVCTVSSTALHTLTGKRYIGRKYFWQLRKPRGGGRRVKSESDWKKYYGGSSELTEDRKQFGNLVFKRDILKLHKTKGLVNFEETRQLFINNVLTEAMSDGTPAFTTATSLVGTCVKIISTLDPC